MKQVVLSGYFGAGNLGDDILLITSYRTLRRILPASAIRVRSASPAGVQPLIGEDCEVSAAPPRPVDRGVVYGGGGLFFGFRSDGLGGHVRQRAARLLGGPFLQKWHAVRHRDRGTAFAAALGIGVGPFVPGSRAEWSAALALSQCGFVSVRDPESYRLCRRWRLAGLQEQGTDLAFGYRNWVPASSSGAAPRARKIGVVIRHWRQGIQPPPFRQPLGSAVRMLRSEGIEARFISLHPAHDEPLLRTLEAGEDALRWTPSGQTVDAFLAGLSEFDVIVSERAHGAILGACLGIPGVCVEIEPKLSNVQRMLHPHFSLWSPPYDPAQLVRQVLQHLGTSEEDRSRLGLLVRERREQAGRMQEGLLTFLSSVL